MGTCPKVRSPRIEYAGAVYHVMSRGMRGENIFLDDRDRELFLRTLEETLEQTGWSIHAYGARHFNARRLQDVLEVCDGLSRKDNAEAKQILDRMVAMLTKLGKRGYTVRESSLDYSHVDSNPDSDFNPDSE